MHASPASPQITRRRFLAAASVALAAPHVLTAQKSGRSLFVGTGAHRYEVLHDWAQLPSPYSWQTTHNVAVDREGLLYVIHEGREELKDHPAIFVFDAQGNSSARSAASFRAAGTGSRCTRRAASSSSTSPVISS